MSFSLLKKNLSGCESLVFFDVEGTQFSHTAIAIGVLIVPFDLTSFALDKDNILSYHSYVLTKDNIGSYVEKLTGITSELLKEKGKPFHQVIQEITALLPKGKKKFISYGSNDINMINASIDHKDENEVKFYKNVSRNYLDFHQYLGKRIVNEKGQSYSIEKLMNLFSVELEEDKLHDPLYDSECLYRIFDAYIQKEDQDVKLIMEHLLNNPYNGKICSEIAQLVYENGKAEKEEFLPLIKNSL